MAVKSTHFPGEIVVTRYASLVDLRYSCVLNACAEFFARCTV